MYKSVRKLIAILLLLALPLQGLSAVLMPFHCLTDEQDEAATVLRLLNTTATPPATTLDICVVTMCTPVCPQWPY